VAWLLILNQAPNVTERLNCTPVGDQYVERSCPILFFFAARDREAELSRNPSASARTEGAILGLEMARRAEKNEAAN
jgi:hypothetical protein